MKGIESINRPSWDTLFIKIAEDVALRSTCIRLSVGAVIVNNNRIVSIGYNGSLPNSKHCVDHFIDIYNSKVSTITLDEWLKTKEFLDLHLDWSNRHELHAEQNAIIFAAKKGISIENTTLYVTTSPCIICSKLIAQSGIIRVVYKNEYDREQDGLQLLRQQNIVVEKYKGDRYE